MLPERNVLFKKPPAWTAGIDKGVAHCQLPAKGLQIFTMIGAGFINIIIHRFHSSCVTEKGELQTRNNSMTIARTIKLNIRIIVRCSRDGRMEKFCILYVRSIKDRIARSHCFLKLNGEENRSFSSPGPDFLLLLFPCKSNCAPLYSSGSSGSAIKELPQGHFTLIFPRSSGKRTFFPHREHFLIRNIV